VSHCGLAIYRKKYFKAKEELQKLKYFSMQKYNLQKFLHKNQNPSRYPWQFQGMQLGTSDST
jgi:hypothetical protein